MSARGDKHAKKGEKLAKGMKWMFGSGKSRPGSWKNFSTRNQNYLSRSST